MPAVSIEKDRCKGCSTCVERCPQKVLEMAKEINVKGFFFAQPAKPHLCIGCRICAISCPDVAIEIAVSGTRYHYFEY
jgi:2-oxoglutarate ferredoxin oxidoreductase subunit delta